MKAWWAGALLVAATSPAQASGSQVKPHVALPARSKGLQAANASSTAGRRACSDEELAKHALLLAFGPAPGTTRTSLWLAPPDCAPSAGQGLWPLRRRRAAAAAGATEAVTTGPATAGPLSLGASPHARRAVATHGGASSKVEHQGRGSANLVHVLVVQSHEYWCKHPCESPTWELQAPKPSGKNGSYRLLEVAIWRQERRVTLYRFDDYFEERARNTYNDVCMGSWGCPMYSIMRESHKLISVGPWPQSLDLDPGKLSVWMKDAFKQIFEKIHQAEPGGAPLALTYTGHGSSADGALFEGAVEAPDALELLGYITGVGGAQGLSLGRLAVLNFGSNCAEGRWKMIDALHPFADWIAASDLKVGGLNLDNLSQEEMRAVAQAQNELDDLSVIKETSEAGTPVPQMLEQVVQARESLWTGVLAAPITQQHLRQTIAVFASDKFAPFAESLRGAYQKLPADKVGSFEQTVTDAECDVLVAADVLDGGAAGGGSSGPLRKAFLEMRSAFASTKGLFQWGLETYGLGFNFLGWRGDGGCDFASALGKHAAA